MTIKFTFNNKIIKIITDMLIKNLIKDLIRIPSSITIYHIIILNRADIMNIIKTMIIINILSIGTTNHDMVFRRIRLMIRDNTKMMELIKMFRDL